MSGRLGHRKNIGGEVNMKFKISTLLFGVLILAVTSGWAGVSLLESSDQGMLLELSCPQPQFEGILIKGMEYFRVTAAGCPGQTEPGRPALPIIGTMIMIPPNTIPEIVYTEKAEAVDYKKIPAPAPEILAGKETAPDPVYYLGSRIHPAQIVELSRPARAGLHKLAFVSFNPLRYNPASRTMSFIKSIKVRIRFRPSELGDQPLSSVKSGQPLAGIGAIAPKNAINPNQSGQWVSRPASGKNARTTAWADSLPFKILIEEEGIYKIGYYDLQQAGLNPDNYDPRSYKIFHQGREIPIYFKGQADGVFDLDDYFEFYGQRLKGDSSYYHPYSRENVYWLGLGGSFGARMIEEEGNPLNQNYVLPGSSRYKIHLEKDSLFYRLNGYYSDQTDRWFWRRIDEGDSMVLNFTLPGLDAGAVDSAKFSIMLHGYTDLSLSTNDHWAIATLNDTSLSNNIVWDGQSPYLFEAMVGVAGLAEGQNRLVLKHGPLDTIDSYFLNWVEVEYSRRYTADGGRLAFKSPSKGSDSLLRYELSGFDTQNIDLYKLGVSKITGGRIERDLNGLTYRLTFDDRASAQTVYHAVQNDDQHKLKPKAIVPNHVPAKALNDPTQAAQYLIITTEEFSASADRLAAIRGTQYNGAKVILASDIYDAFNYGIPADRPIKDFLRQAFLTWQSPPEYVLLLGGGSWDPRNLLGHSSADKIPVHLTRTNSFGPVADDNYYADILEDDIFSSIPDIAVGRIPVFNSTDHQIWEAKQLSYEQQLLLDQWQRDFMLISGRNDAANDFCAGSDALAAALDPRYTVSKVYHSNPATTQDLIDQFNEGSVMAGFYGHGGGQVWSHDSFFRIDEVARLNNWGRWPFLGSFTCYSGAFDIPDTVSLSQAMLLKTYGGAIGVYANSGPSWGNLMEQTFFDAVDDLGLKRFGDILISSKLGLAGGYGSVSGQAGEMITSYNLLGDPGMNLAVPSQNISMTLIPASLLPGDSLTVKLYGSFKAGSITLLSLCDSTGQPAANYSLFSDSAGKVEARLLVPAAMAPGKALMKAFVKDADSSWIACGEMGLNQPVFYGLTVSPSRPVNMVDSIAITSGASSLGGVDSVWCEWHISNNGSDTIMPDSSTVMDSLGQGYFKTRTKIFSPAPNDTVLNYRICLSGPGVARAVSKWQRLHIFLRPDLTPVKSGNIENAYLGGKRRLTLFADIYNYGETRADSIPVHFYRYNDGLPIIDSAVTVVDSLLPGGSFTPSVPWKLDSLESDRISLSIDPNQLCRPADQNPGNNGFNSTYIVIPQGGRVYHQLGRLGSGDTMTTSEGSLKYFLPDSGLSDSAVAVLDWVTFDPASELNPVHQPGLRMIGDLMMARTMSFTDSTRVLENNKKLWINLAWSHLDTMTHLSLVNLYRFNHRQGLWQKVPGGADTMNVWGFSDSLGTFMPMIGVDTTAPVITARLEQQATGWGNQIRVSRPQYSVLLEDQNGINLDSVWIKKDGVMVPRSDYNLPAQPQDPNSVPLAYAPYLNDGQHTLEFGAGDNLGNSSAVAVQLTVAAEFGLYELACYPTPVDGENATFYFFVGDHAKQYELKIYTVAGRLIRTFSGGSVSGIKTLNWDVADGSGQKVANGVYFYTVQVWNDDGKQQKKTEKLAVLR
jgi:hypothetical protein